MTQPLPPQLEFLRIFWALDHAMQSRSKSMQKTIGLSGPQRVALRIIGHCPGLSAGELAERLHIHPSTLTGILQRLERRGLVASAPGPQDRRRRHLQLTPAGQMLNQPQPGSVEECLRPLIEQIPPRDQAVIRRVLEEMTRALQRTETHQAAARPETRRG